MRVLVATAALAGAAAVASAQDPAIVDFTGGSPFGIFYGGSTGDVVGWRFTVNSPITATHLGVWNMGPGGSLTSDHQVGIWDSSQTLLASTTVTPGSMAIGVWNYERIAGLALSPGETYTIGAMYTATDEDSYLSGTSSLTMDPEVNFQMSVFPSEGSLGFVYPTNETPGSNGRFGPNFLWVPTPGTVGLLALGGLLACRRRR